MSKNKENVSEKKAVKGSGKGKVAGGVGIVGVAAALIALLSGKIPGLGNGAQIGIGKEAQTTAVTAEQTEPAATETTALTSVTAAETVTATETAAETTATTKGTVYIEVTVNGNGYTYQNRSYTSADLQTLTDALEAACKEAGNDTVIRITNQDASLNAYNALTEKLTTLSLRFEEAKS